MGNCMRRESTMVWAGDDWESVKSSSTSKSRRFGSSEVEKERLLGGDFRSLELGSCNLSSTTSFSDGETREVKIKISKKELEELLAKSGGGLSVEQVISRLINGGDLQRELEHQRSWRPSLQSIPEVN